MSVKHKGTLYQGHEVISRNKKYRLKLHYNGNLVFYEGNRVKWESATFQGKGPFRLDMQTDNNLVLYECRGKPLMQQCDSESDPSDSCDSCDKKAIWTTDTCFYDGCKNKMTTRTGSGYLSVSDDGNFYIRGGTPVWSSYDKLYKDKMAKGKMEYFALFKLSEHCGHLWQTFVNYACTVKTAFSGPYPACSWADKKFTASSGKDVSKAHCGNQKRADSACYAGDATLCQKKCQDVDPAVGICTHFFYNDNTNDCLLYNGEMSMEESTVDLKTRIGPAYCIQDSIKIAKQVAKTATAGWVRVAVCKNTADIELSCEYEKMVGVAKMNGGSRSESSESSTELSHTLGISATVGYEAEANGVVVRQMVYGEITTAFEHSWGSSNTWSQESET